MPRYLLFVYRASISLKKASSYTPVMVDYFVGKNGIDKYLLKLNSYAAL